MENPVKMKIKNLFKAIIYQFKKPNWFKNWFITRNAFGIFSMHSHVNKNGNTKVGYPKETSAIKAADSMGKKHNTHFSVYKCAHCDFYHIGKNRDNKKPDNHEDATKTS